MIWPGKFAGSSEEIGSERLPVDAIDGFLPMFLVMSVHSPVKSQTHSRHLPNRCYGPLLSTDECVPLQNAFFQVDVQRFGTYDLD